MSKRVLFKFDAGNDYGLGHLSRCYALAQRLLDYGIEVKFFINGNLNINVAQKLTNNQIAISIIDPLRIEEFTNQITTNDVLIIDSYEINTDQEKNLKNVCKKLIVIDDFKNKNHIADAIINTSVYDIDNKDTAIRYFLGIEYALLRKEFFVENTFNGGERKGVLISMGGSDPQNITIYILKTLFDIGQNLPIHVIYTNSFSTEQLNLLLDLSKKGLIYANFLKEPHEVVELMDKCCYGVFSASNVLLEGIKRNLKCAFGYYTDNQREIYNVLLQQNAGIGLEHFKGGLGQNLSRFLSISLPYNELSSKISSKIQEIINFIINEN